MSRLFPTLLGESFNALPERLRALHTAPAGTLFRGRARVERGVHPFGRLLALAAGLPPAGEVEVTVRVDVDDHGERWHRRFGGHRMSSRLWPAKTLLRERLGLATFDFELTADAGGLDWTVVGVRAIGVPLPTRWFAGVCARELLDEGRYAFDVGANLPLIGLIVRYRGWLDVD